MARSAKEQNRYLPYEQIMDQHGIEYRYVASVALDDIVRDEDSQARIRLSGLPVTKDYATKMKAGQVFPPMVVWENGKDSYVLLDGNARKAAKRSLGHTHTDAYIINDLEGIDQAVYVSSLFNTLNGEKLDRDEKIRAVRSAKRMSIPMSDARIAQTLGISAGEVSKILSLDNFNARVRKLGLPEDAIADANAKRTLSKLADDAVFTDAFHLIRDSGIKGPDVTDLVKRTAAAPSEAERRKLLADERNTLAETIRNHTNGRSATTPPVMASLRAFGMLRNLLQQYPNASSWVPAQQDVRTKWHDEVAELGAFLTRLADAYEDAGLDTLSFATGDESQASQAS